MKKRFLFLAGLLFLIPTFYIKPQPAEAAASLSVSSGASYVVNDTVTIQIKVNTNGQAANAFEGTFSYPTELFEGVRGTYSGSICTLPITTPDPSNGSATFSCGTPSGFTGTGTVATIVLTAKNAGTGNFGLSGCQVLANDGQGTDITGGCSGVSITVTGTPTPTPIPTATATATPTPTPIKPTPTPVKTPVIPTKPNQTPKPAENPNNNSNPAATPTPGAPAAQTLPATTPTPTPTATPTPSAEPETVGEKRSISTAFKDLLNGLKNFLTAKKDVSSLVALLFTLIPFLALLLAIVYFVYRLYVLERRRKRMLDRLFEVELSELAALEGKMDLLAEKGSKGRQQYREEFEKAKENILRQIKPNYGKPLEAAKGDKAPETPPV